MKHEIDKYGEFWYDDDMQLHRDDGPAIIWDTFSCEYYQHGKLHRLDGPARHFRYVDEWYIDGERIDCNSNEEFLRIVKMKELL
jgi:hypothetical protein